MEENSKFYLALLKWSRLETSEDSGAIVKTEDSVHRESSFEKLQHALRVYAQDYDGKIVAVIYTVKPIEISDEVLKAFKTVGNFLGTVDYGKTFGSNDALLPPVQSALALLALQKSLKSNQVWVRELHETQTFGEIPPHTCSECGETHADRPRSCFALEVKRRESETMATYARLLGATIKPTTPTFKDI